MTIAEIRRLFNLNRNDDHVVELGLYWSEQRRRKQSRARRHHFIQRLRLQVLQI